MSAKIAIRQDHHIYGRYGELITTRDIYRFGLQLATMAKETETVRFAVCSDRRNLNQIHVHSLVGGLQGGDCDVVFLGVAPLSLLNHAMRSRDISHGVMMTSGNAEDGTIGFRAYLNQKPIPSYALKEILDSSFKQKFEDICGNGRLSDTNLTPSYLRWLMHGCRPGHFHPSILWDAGNGTACDILTGLACSLPGRHVVRNCENLAPCIVSAPDTTLKDLAHGVTTGDFDLGIAINGDGSDLLMVDNLGLPIGEWHRLQFLSMRRGRQPIAGNGLLASRRKARSDVIKHALKVIQAIGESGLSAADLRAKIGEPPATLGKGSVACHVYQETPSQIITA